MWFGSKSDPEPNIERMQDDFKLTKKRSDGDFTPCKSGRGLSGLGYEMGEVIGEGEFSKVRVAYCPKLRRKVAVKVISKTKSPKEYLSDFAPTEVSILQHLNHIYMIDIYRALESRHSLYLVMEYAANGDLLDYVNSKGHLDEAESRALFRQLIEAVAYLHRVRVVHRDIRPENCLLAEGNQLKLADFGFARWNRSKTVLSSYCGCRAYAAPEVVESEPHDGEKADIWSMGATLFAMLNGREPFPDSDDIGILLNSMAQKFRFHQRCSKEARLFVRRMMNLDPAARPNAVDLRHDVWVEQACPLTDAYSQSSVMTSALQADLDLSQEHGLAEGQHTFEIPPKTVSKVLKSVALNNIDTDESLVRVRRGVARINSSAIGIRGPAARRISIALSSNLDVSKLPPRGASSAKGLAAGRKMSSMLRRSSVMRSGSQVQLPAQEIVDAMARQRHEDTEKEMGRIHCSTGSQFAAAVGKARRQSIAADRFEMEYVQHIDDKISEETGYIMGQTRGKMERLRHKLERMAAVEEVPSEGSGEGC